MSKSERRPISPENPWICCGWMARLDIASPFEFRMV
ncbi:hypothetical protein T190_06005 [Sinorhizobium meliloti CCBAU 01290]|nr:hypothetical protein T190_06005 [Sinorhizobium meliloti CCBAU 01290]